MSDYYDRDKFTGGRQNPQPPRRNQNNSGWYSWPLIIVLFSLGLWPIALVLLCVNLFGEGKKVAGTSRNGNDQGRGESAVERAMRRAEDRASDGARRAAEQMNRAAERVDRAMRAAQDMASQAVEMSRAPVGRVGLHTPDEMAKILNDALDRAKARAAKERERQAAQEARQSQSTPGRSGYADARPQPGPAPRPAPGPDVRHGGQKQAAKPQKQKKLKIPGKGLRVVGIVFLVLGAILGLDFLADVAQGYWVNFEQFFTSLGFLAGGGIMFGRGRYLANMTRRSQRYILAIGNVDVMRLDEIAKRVNRKPAQAEKELQKLIDKGYLGEDAYIDHERGYFLRFGATLEEDQRREQEEEEVFTPPPAPAADSEEGPEAVLENIRRANRRISDPELTRKIDRIEQVTALIFKEVEEHPEKKEKIVMFFDYYLPTTQKLLDTYADFAETGVEGSNLRQAKARIEQTMDAIVEGFERQLDQLYSSDAMDVVTDLKVMEALLNRDGATASQDFGYHEDEKKDGEDGGFRPLQL